MRPATERDVPPVDRESEPPALEGFVRRQTPVRVADVLVELIAREGVDVVFGIPGGAIVAVLDALIDRPDIRVITNHHECAAVFAAAAYARATGKVGVVVVTSGPGVLNTVTGLASAWCDGLPVVVIAGDVPRDVVGRGALQEGSSSHLNIVGTAKNVCKLAFEINRPEQAAAALHRAFKVAQQGRRGPVLVNIPLDVTTQTISRPGIVFPRNGSTSLGRDLRQKIANTLWNAERLAIFAGSGCRWGKGPQELLRLAERLQAPVLTTPKGKGVFPEDHPLSVGVFGHGGHPSAHALLSQGVDVLLALGTGMTDPATNGWSHLLVPSQHLIQVDADPSQLGRNYSVSVGVVGEVDVVLREVRRALPSSIRRRQTYGVERIFKPASTDAEGRLRADSALRELQSVLPRSTIYTSDIGSHLLTATHALEISTPDGFVIMTGLASMGSGLASAIGCKLAQPNRPVVAICGDACFAMYPGELAVAAREQLPVIVAVINNGNMGMVRHGQSALYGRAPSYSTAPLCITTVAQGLGAKAFIIRRSGDIEAIAAELVAPRQPVVLDICVTDTVNEQNERFQQLSNTTGAESHAPRT